MERHFSNWSKLQKIEAHYTKGEPLFLLQGRMDRIFCLIQGRVQLSYYNEKGDVYQIAEISAPSILGEVEYILHSAALTEAVAMTKVHCIELPVDVNRDLLKKDLVFSQYLNLQLANKLTHVNLLVSGKTLESVEDRLLSYIKEQELHDIHSLSDLRSISQKLPCSYRQLLRIIQKLCAEGILIPADKRGHYHINGSS